MNKISFKDTVYDISADYGLIGTLNLLNIHKCHIILWFNWYTKCTEYS